MVLTVQFELHFLEIENDVGHVLNDSGQCGELMLCPGNFYRGDRCTFERGKQDASEAVPNCMTVAGFERLGCELCISICGHALVFRESFWHFETTVTDWHNLTFDCRFSIFDWMRNSITNRQSQI